MKKERRKLIHEALFKNPMLLLVLKDKESLEYINNLLPFDTGFEIECGVKFPNLVRDTIKTFQNIPNIKHVDVNDYEQRFRIPNGLAGLICLYNISLLLKLHHEFNPASGIHYHIDCVDYEHYYKLSNNITEKQKEYLLKQLDKWEYKGTYNARGVSTVTNWIRMQYTFNTFEIRIGEMTFDYSLLVRRIIHGHQILRRFRRYKKVYPQPYEPVNIDVRQLEDFISNNININVKQGIANLELQKKLDDLTNKLKALQTNPEKIDNNEEVKNIVSSRITKI
jgi:hypothetical protein